MAPGVTARVTNGAAPAVVRPLRRTERKALTRQRLIDASCRLFMEQGFEQTTIDQITAEAGVSRASFYLHFPSKEAVVRAMLEHVGENLRAEYKRLARLGNADVGRLARWVNDFVVACLADRSIVYLLQRNFPSVLPMFNDIEFYGEMMILLGTKIPRFREAADGGSRETHADAMLFFFELQSLARYVSHEDFVIDRDEICRAIARRLYRFIHQVD